jgi:hypothetical protein
MQESVRVNDDKPRFTGVGANRCIQAIRADVQHGAGRYGQPLTTRPISCQRWLQNDLPDNR